MQSPIDILTTTLGPVDATDPVELELASTRWTVVDTGHSIEARPVTEGWLRASHRATDPGRSTELSPYHTHTSPEPLQPGTIYPFAIEIWPTCWVFQAGHRLRLDLAALDQQGQYYLGHLRATDTIYHDPGHPSHLTIPVIPHPPRPRPPARERRLREEA